MVVLTFMQLSWLCMVRCFIVKICAPRSCCKIKTYTKIAKIWHLKVLQQWNKTSNNNSWDYQASLYGFFIWAVMLFLYSLCCASWALCLGVGNKNPFKVQVLSVGRWQCLVWQRGKWQWKLRAYWNSLLDSDHGINSLICAWGSGCSLEAWCGQQAQYGEKN